MIQPFFLAQLPEYSRFEARAALFVDTLCASPCGQAVAWVTREENYEVVHHSILGALDGFTFSVQDYTRVIRAWGDRVYLWGKRNARAGFWIWNGTDFRLVQPMDHILGMRGRPGERHYWGISDADIGAFVYPFGRSSLWPVNPTARVVWSQDGLVILEKIAGVTYAYHAGIQGADALLPVVIGDGEQVECILSWQGRIMIAVRSPSRVLDPSLGYEVTLPPHSRLVELRAPGEGVESRPVRFDFGGILERVWVSPSGKTLVFLERPMNVSPEVRRLITQDGHHWLEGTFFLADDAIVWSPDEGHSSVRAERRNEEGEIEEECVASLHDVRVVSKGAHAQEWLVNNEGELTAVLLRGQGGDTPFISGIRLQQVPLAWNLRYAADGSITWNTMDERGQVFAWVSF